MTHKIIDLEQGSAEWLAYRRTKITATDTASVLGIAYKKTALQLWEEKIGLREPEPENEAMREGKRLEEQARKFLNEKCGTEFQPIVVISQKYEFMMASLDGIDLKNNKLLEIKCGKSSHELVLKGEVPDYYNAQCQKQMFVCGFDKIIYFSYRSDDDNCCITIYRDDDFIEKMIEAEKEFYRCMMEFQAPPATDRDFIHKGDKDWYKHATLWRQAKRDLKLLEAREAALRDVLIEMCDGQSSQGAGVRISKQTGRGRIDYTKIEELKHIDIEKYRSKPIVSYRFTEMKGQDNE